MARIRRIADGKVGRKPHPQFKGVFIVDRSTRDVELPGPAGRVQIARPAAATKTAEPAKKTRKPRKPKEETPEVTEATEQTEAPAEVHTPDTATQAVETDSVA